MKKKDKKTVYDQQSNDVTSFAHSPHVSRRNIEKKLMALIALGIPALFDLHIGDIFKQTAALLPGISLTQAKFTSASLTTLTCRTVIGAGVPVRAAHAVSDKYLIHFDTADDPHQVWEIAQQMLREFCDLVNTHSLTDYSSAVRQCCEHIHLKLHGNVSLEELGEVCHLSPHYVSDIFRKEMGVGALQYAHQVKMQYAKFLLEHSDLGIAEIASSLSYPSHSNFSQRFKRTYGVTPHEFRAAFG